jgi:hypothetical protein
VVGNLNIIVAFVGLRLGSFKQQASSLKQQAASCFSDYLRDSIISVYSTYRVVVWHNLLVGCSLRLAAPPKYP